MKDFKAIFKTYSGKIKDNVGLKAELGKKFKEGGFENNHELYYLNYNLYHYVPLLLLLGYIFCN